MARGHGQAVERLVGVGGTADAAEHSLVDGTVTVPATIKSVPLSVPVIAALGGVLLLAEPASLRLVVASVLTLGGIWLVLSRRGRQRL